MRFAILTLIVVFGCSQLGCTGGANDDNDAKVKAMLGPTGGRIDMRGVGQKPMGAKEPKSGPPGVTPGNAPAPAGP